MLASADKSRSEMASGPARSRRHILTWPGADAAEAGEAGLADVGRGQKGDEFGVLERAHGPPYRTHFHLNGNRRFFGICL